MDLVARETLQFSVSEFAGEEEDAGVAEEFFA